MHLLVITQYFWPENFRINDLVRTLVSRGHRVSVLTGLPNYPDGKLYSTFRRSPGSYNTYHGCTIYRIPMLPRGHRPISLLLNYLSFAAMASTIGVFKLRNHKFDALFVFQPSPITVGIPAIILKALLKKPLVFWVQDLWPESLEALGVIKSQYLLAPIAFLVRTIYNRCDLILAQSRSFIPSIRKHTRTTTLYFPNWSDNPLPGSVNPAAEVPPAPHLFTVMFAGNIGDAQDFPSILAAAELLKHHPIRWLIVGDGRAASWLLHEISQRSLESNVFMLGRHPSSRMPSFYRHADALLVSLRDQPIFSLTVPSKLQSYLSTGLPVIAMLNGEGASIVRQSRSGLVCPAGDYQSLAQIVVQLSQFSPQQRFDMGANGLRFSQREYDRNILISRLEHLINRLMLSSPN